MRASIALLSGLVDYAGLFPPASLDMPSAVRNYDAYRRGPHAWMLGRLIVPASRLGEFEAVRAGLAVGGARIPVARQRDPRRRHRGRHRGRARLQRRRRDGTATGDRGRVGIQSPVTGRYLPDLGAPPRPGPGVVRDPRPGRLPFGAPCPARRDLPRRRDGESPDRRRDARGDTDVALRWPRFSGTARGLVSRSRRRRDSITGSGATIA